MVDDHVQAPDRVSGASRWRTPYSGEGIHGCLLSARIDRNWADGHERISERAAADALQSAERWEQQAAVLVQQETAFMLAQLEPDGWIRSY